MQLFCALEEDKRVAIHVGQKHFGLSRKQWEQLTHGEGQVLAQMWVQNNGKPLGDVTVYVDRKTCDHCRLHLPAIAKAMGINKLTIVDRKGLILDIENGTL